MNESKVINKKTVPVNKTNKKQPPKKIRKVPKSKFGKFMQKHALKISIIVLILTLIILFLVFFFKFLMPDSLGTTKYGDRDIQAKKVKTEEAITSVTNHFKEKDDVETVSAKSRGTVFNIFIKVKETVTKDRVKEMSDAVIEKIPENVKSAFDIQIFVESEAEGYPMIGYKHKSRDKFAWDNR